MTRVHHHHFLTAECGLDELSCDDGEVCVPNSAICDGRNDCADGADELNCVLPGTYIHYTTR